MPSQCSTAQLVKIGISPKSMTVNLNVDTNVSELIYIMVFDMPIDADNLLLHEQAPRLGDTNPFLPSKYATNITPRDTGNSTVWEILVSYDIMGAPPIEEGFAYDFGSRSITTEVAATGAYVRRVYEVDKDNGSIIAIGQDETDDNGLIPLTTTAGQTYEDPLMTKKTDVLLTFWMLSTKKTEEQVKDGSIYKFIGSTNTAPIVLCGIPVADYAVTIEDIIPTQYRYYQEGATEPQERFKLRFEVRFDPNATRLGTGVLSQGRNARLFPKGATSGDLALREIYLSDIDPSAVPEGSTGDKEIDYDVLLNSQGLILDKDTENIAYVGYVVQDLFAQNELSLPTKIGNYAAI